MESSPTTTAGRAAEPLQCVPAVWLGLKAAGGCGYARHFVLVCAGSFLSWLVGHWGCGSMGFVTGGICVWLVVREHLWNWPVGLANNVFFFVLFLRGRLYADMSLQIVYFGLGVYGWLNWIFGGREPHRFEDQPDHTN